MKALPIILMFSFLALMPAVTASADPEPAKGPAGSIGDIKVQTLKGYTYAYVSTRTTLNKIQDAISQLLPKIDAAVDSGALRPLGPVVFTYHGASGDPTKEFGLDIGIIIKDKGTKPDGITIEKVDPQQCATAIYTGPVNGIGSAYGKLYEEIGKRGLQPTDVTREVYLYWEDANSENNILQLQAQLPAAPGN